MKTFKVSLIASMNDTETLTYDEIVKKFDLDANDADVMCSLDELEVGQSQAPYLMSSCEILAHLDCTEHEDSSECERGTTIYLTRVS